LDILGVNWADAVQAIASILGFGVLICQLQRLESTIQGETHSKLYTHYLEVNKLFLDKPYLHPYFYEGKVLNKSDCNQTNLRQELDMMCEVVLGLLEHAVLQKENLPDESWRTCWVTYVRDRYDKSIELAKFFRTNRKLYAKPLCDLIDDKDIRPIGI
jgi:hypothetical protein